MPVIQESSALNSLPPKPVGRRFFLLIILGILLIALAAGLLFFVKPKQLQENNAQLETFVESFKNETSDLAFPSEKWEDELLSVYSKVLSEKDESRQFETLSQSYTMISKVYFIKPEEKTRKSLEKLKNYLRENYQTQYKEENFAISCIDDGCDLPELPKEIEDFSVRVEKLEIDPLIKQKTLESFETARTYEENSERWPLYDSAFQLLKSEYEKDKTGSNLKDLMQDLLDYIEANFPEEIKNVERREGKDNHYILE